MRQQQFNLRTGKIAVQQQLSKKITDQLRQQRNALTTTVRWKHTTAPNPLTSAHPATNEAVICDGHKNALGTEKALPGDLKRLNLWELTQGQRWQFGNNALERVMGKMGRKRVVTPQLSATHQHSLSNENATTQIDILISSLNSQQDVLPNPSIMPNIVWV